MAILKRKRSESEMSFSSQLSSPPRPGDAYFAFPVTPIGLAFPTRSSNPSHLDSRTMKRHRDNRPSETEVHQHTLELLYSARDVPSEHLQHAAHSQYHQTQQPASSASTRNHTQQNTAPRQTSLHSFWNLPRASGKAPSMLSLSSPSTVLEPTSCDDCGSSLRSDDDGMDLDGDACGGAAACSCGKIVCFSCSVSNLGEHRRCLMCAGRGNGASRLGWNGL